MSQFKQYVEANSLSVERIFYSSARLERHGVADRTLRVQREGLRRDGKGGAGYAEAGVGKPRSGRGVSRQRIEAALAGQPLSAKVRAKLARAVGALVAQKGGAAPTLGELFGDVHARHGAAAASAPSGEAA